MTSDEQNKMTGWKARMDAMEHIDGELVLDKASAWEKTQQRLFGKPRKKMIWYWVAAVCVGLMVIFLRMKMDREILPVTQSIRAMPSVAKEAPPISDHRETESRVIVSGKKKPTNFKVSRNRVMETIVQKLMNRPDSSAFAHSEVSILQQAEIKIDSSAVLLSTVNVHKQLPVVHINELEENENADNRIADEHRNKDSKIRIKKDRKSTKQAMAISGSSLGHLTIEIRLNN